MLLSSLSSSLIYLLSMKGLQKQTFQVSMLRMSEKFVELQNFFVPSSVIFVSSKVL